jgi:predicted dehydrogenase
MPGKIKIGFIGAGGIARPHAFAINSLKYYYRDAPEVSLVSVSSASVQSRESFAADFGFSKAVSPRQFFTDNEIDTVYILGPNSVHFDHFSEALKMPSIKRIYIEKPLCSGKDEEFKMTELSARRPDVTIQAGFQYLFMTAVREAVNVWKSGVLGVPLHFEIKYFHGDYLQKSYRDKRANRLTPSPDGGAMADLGSHAISLAVAFLGNGLKVNEALKAGKFPDVDPYSDLFSLITLSDSETGAAGTLSASRIASGSGDTLSMEFYCTKGCLRFSSQNPDYLEYYLEETGTWTRKNTGSNYPGVTSFPSGHVPAGWLRAMIHAHYIFLTGNKEDVMPDIKHALEVQRIVREFSEIIKAKLP